MSISAVGRLFMLLGFLCLTTGTVFGQESPNPERNAYFGETHLHTSWSFDAYIFGNHLTGPAEAYQYAKGQTIKHPLGYDIKIDTPLDWMGVTDHSEYVGTVRLANEPGSFLSKLPIAEKLVVHDAADIQRIYLWLGTAMIEGHPIKELFGSRDCRNKRKENNQIANQANDPGKFTAFCSLRMDCHAGFSQHASQYFFQGLRPSAGNAFQLSRFGPPRGSLELDGCAAQEGR